MANQPSPLTPDSGRLRRKLERGNRPYVTLKAASTLDGRIATRSGASKWITGPDARGHAHRLRAGHDGILVGIETVIVDDPRLTARLPDRVESPARVVLDSKARIRPDARMLAEDGVRRMVVTGNAVPERRAAALRLRGVEVLTCSTARPEPAEYLPMLRAAGLATLLVEGGARVHENLIAHGEADELFLYVAPSLIGDHAAPGWCGQLGVERLEDSPRLAFEPPQAIGQDILLHAFFQ